MELETLTAIHAATAVYRYNSRARGRFQIHDTALSKSRTLSAPLCESMHRRGMLSFEYVPAMTGVQRVRLTAEALAVVSEVRL